MATLQSTIPFKARKRTYAKEKLKSESFYNGSDITLKDSNRNLKRQNYSDVSSDDEECSPTKISRINRRNDSEDVLTLTKRNIEPLKPLTSRETEIMWLHNFLSSHLESEKSASLYISGQPGTGKTASLSYLLQLPEFKNGYKHVYVNCTMMKSAASIYKRLCSELQLKTNGSTEKACLTSIEKYFSNKHKMTLLVLDEIDQLCSKRQSVLYSIFEWPSWLGSRLVLIGVANALDLVERSLPRLLARCSLRPETLHFAPYTKQQIVDIFESKIAQENKNIVFAPVALQMIAAKISAISGDVRRALDVAKQVVEIAKRNQENHPTNGSTTVELKHVLEVFDDVYGNPKKIQNDMDEGIPIHQKLILCSLMLMLTKGKNKHVTLANLYDVYKKVTQGRNLSALDMGEFISACDLLQCLGALRVATNGKRVVAPSFRRVILQWNENDLIGALRDRAFLSAVLDDVKCLAS